MRLSRSLFLVSLLGVSSAFSACGGGDDPGGDGDGDGDGDMGGDPGDGDGDLVAPCPDDTFGPDCEPCDCGDGICNDGRFGDGTCSDCPRGTFGAACEESCPGSSGGEVSAGGASSDVSECASVLACNQDTGVPTHCDECHPGFFGKQCNKECSDNVFNCGDVVACTQGGLPTECASCKPGFFGPTCESECLPSPHCASVDECNFESGQATVCGTCDVGWRGKLCDTRRILALCELHDEGTAPVIVAANALGYEVTESYSEGSAQDITEFTTAFDAGDWDLVVYDLANYSIDDAVLTRLIAGAEAGTPQIFYYWSFSSSSEKLDQLKSLFGVTTEDNPTPRSLKTSATASFDLFNGVESFPSPLVPEGDYYDNGDFLIPTEDGGAAVLLVDSVEDKPLAILDKTGTQIALGFATYDYIDINLNVDDHDADLDGKRDIDELFTNLISH